MRGTLATPQVIAALNGIIPAYAGNTLNILSEYDDRGDHPRVCGEHRR